MRAVADALGFQSPSAMLRDVLITLGMSILALFCSTIYSLGPLLTPHMSTDLGWDATASTVINGVALIGLQFTLFAGLVLDRWGGRPTVLVGLVLSVGCWTGVSFIPNGTPWPVALLLLVLCGFGQGFAFLAVFKTALQMNETGGGVPIGLVSCGMSLSLSVAVASVGIYGDPNAQVWRAWCRVFAVETAIAYAIGFVAVLFFRVGNYPWLLAPAEKQLQQAPDEGEADALLQEKSAVMTATGPDSKVGVLRTVRIFLHPYFWVIFLAYFGGVGGSVSVTSTLHNTWLNYIGGTLCDEPVNPDTCPYYGQIAVISSAFSYASAGANIVAALLVSILVRRRVISARAMFIITCGLMAGTYVVLGTLFVVPTRTHASSVALSAFFGFAGFLFGCVLNFAGIAFADLYGYANFGAYYSYFQVGGATASATASIIAGAVFARFGTYVPYLFGWAIINGLACLLMIVVPITRFQR